MIALALLVFSYHDGYAESVRTKTPLVTGIGCIAPDGPWVNSTASSLPGYQSPCIVISLPRGDTLYHHATLPANATAGQIRAALPQGRIPPQNGVPFRVQSPTFRAAVQC